MFRNVSLASLGGALGTLLAVASAEAALTVTADVGGAPTGVTRENFDNLPVGTGLAPQATLTGITVSFTGAGRTAIIPNLPGVYAAPFLSGDNGLGFGAGGTDQANGQDATVYLSAGAGGTVVLDLPGDQLYLGLLWGSIDTFNALDFYDNGVLVGTVTGSQAATAAATLPNGNQGGSGTAYVNIVSDVVFDRVVARSSSNAFEFDNVAFNPRDPFEVPAPAALALFGIGLLGLSAVRRRRG